jgi:hypothetical protein
MKKDGPQHVKCDNPALMAGRHISIVAGATYLAICEVQVSLTDFNLDPQQHDQKKNLCNFEKISSD